MFDLTMNEVQRQLVDAYRQALDRIAASPAAASAFDETTWDTFLELGLLEMSLGDDEDRAELLDIALIAEVAGERLASVPLAETVAAVRLLGALSSPQAGKLLTEISSGGVLVTLAPRASRDSVLPSVPAGAIATVVIALDGTEVIAARRADPPPPVTTLGRLPFAHWSLSDCEITTLASGQQAVAAFANAVTEWTALTASLLAGAGRRVVRIGAEYTSQRHAFGVPVATFQTVSHRLAEDLTATDGAVLLARKASWAARCDPARWPLLAEMAFSYAAQAAGRAADDVLHFHGGYGMILEYDIPHFFQRIKGWSLLIGDRLQVLQSVGNRLLEPPVDTHASQGCPSQSDGMDFRLGAEAESFRSEVRALLRQCMSDSAYDEMAASGTYSDPSVATALGARGWIASSWASADGGAERTWADHAAMRDELRWAEAPVDGVFTTMLVAATLKKFGTPEQQERVMRPAVRGELIISIGYTEAGNGSDASAARTTARREGDHWVINGEKMFTTLAHVASYVFVLARTNPEVGKHQGLTTFLVPTDAEGFGVSQLETLSGERTNITTYDNVRIPDSLRVGDIDAGWSVANAALELEHSSTFAGAIRHIVDVAVSAVLAEPDLGRNPLVLMRIGEAAIEAEVSELLGLRASWSHGQGLPSAVEGSMSKLYSSEALARTAGMLLDIFGPMGLPVTRGVGDHGIGAIEYAFRHSQITRVYAGTSEIHRGIIANAGLRLPRPKRAS
jgi:3-oxochol-4-en-24-oyl-CoA dehydrogenase